MIHCLHPGSYCIVADQKHDEGRKFKGGSLTCSDIEHYDLPHLALHY